MSPGGFPSQWILQPVPSPDKERRLGVRKGIRSIKTLPSNRMQDNHDESVNARVYPVLRNAQRNNSHPDPLRRRREGRHCKLRIATLNIRALTGKGREIAAIMVVRGVEILCIQETRWTGGKSGGKARNLGDRCKLYYGGGKQPRNEVGICLSEYWQDKVISVERKSDRIIAMKLVITGMSITILSAYAPQQGCSQEEKDLFWNQMDGVMSGIPSSKEVIVAGDLNGHVGRDRPGVER